MGYAGLLRAALAVFYAQKGQKDRAMEWGERLLSLRPNDPQVIGFVASLRGRRTP